VDYLTLRSGKRVIDISCGSGYILRHLPPSIDYVARSDISDNFTAAISMRRQPVNSPAPMSS
jgi:cyclopropane fatty-acyl-phospholipid synthase-like methyltransferase